jgi:hypothetical protein
MATRARQIRWHSTCLFFTKRLDKDRTDNKKKSEPPPQTSKRPISPASGFFLASPNLLVLQPLSRRPRLYGTLTGLERSRT